MFPAKSMKTNLYLCSAWETLNNEDEGKNTIKYLSKPNQQLPIQK